jgi:hypothetical protein
MISNVPFTFIVAPELLEQVCHEAKQKPAVGRGGDHGAARTGHWQRARQRQTSAKQENDIEEPRSSLADFARTWERTFRRPDQLATSHDVIPLLAELNSLTRRARVGRAR